MFRIWNLPGVIFCMVTLVILASCGIETAEVTPSLASPYITAVTEVTDSQNPSYNDIVLTINYDNNESYFNGLQVYVTNFAGGPPYSGTFVPSTPGGSTSSNSETINNLSAVSSWTTTNFTIPWDAFTPSVLYFTPGDTYYFYVQSYSTIYAISSPQSDLLSIIY